MDSQPRALARWRLLPLAAFAGAAAVLWPQAAAADYNDYYRFPASVGVEYQGLTPLQSYDADYNIFDVSAAVRRPLPRMTVLQPFVRGGVTKFDSQDPLFPDKWDHLQWYGTLGMAYANRFARNFELGADIESGLGEDVFANAVDTGTVGSLNLVVGAGARIGLDPSYSLSIDIHPSVRYLHSLSPLSKYDGFLLGLGFSAAVRADDIVAEVKPATAAITLHAVRGIPRHRIVYRR